MRQKGEKMSDPIERQAAIDELKRISFSHWFECGEYLSEDTREIEIISSKKALEIIEALPSAQPEIVRCKDCEYGKQDEYGRWYCRSLGCQIGNEDGSGFCADAERRTDV